MKYFWGPEEGAGSLGAGFTDSCELLRSGPLEEQQILLTAEPSFHPFPDLKKHFRTGCIGV